MATIANPVGVIDFAHTHDYTTSSYFDDIDTFSEDFATRDIMSGFDPNLFPHYFPTEGGEPDSAFSQPSTRHLHSAPANQYSFVHTPSAASTSSETTSRTMQSTVPSSVSSPELRYPFSQLPDFQSGPNAGYMGSAEQSTYGADPYSAEFTNYPTPLAGGKQSSNVYVGESHGFLPSSSSVENYGLFAGFSLPSNAPSLDPFPFKKPPPKNPSASSKTSSPADASPTLQRALWQSSTSFPASAGGRGSTYARSEAQSAQPVTQSPQAPSHSQDWATLGSSYQNQGFVLPENQLYTSPTLVQDARFQKSPQTQPNQYFHQTSGNFVAPLESSYPSLLSQQGIPTPNPSIHTPTHQIPQVPPPASPVPSHTSSHGMSRTGSSRFKSPRSQSPYLSHQSSWTPYPTRRPVIRSTSRSESAEVDDSERERNRCPHPECGKFLKDLKAHMLTHQTERPEKCPIPSCEYSKKGFSRKYDKNRHTLTHYKGTMVCGFCPGSGSSSEKTFNRTDIFKRHLTTVHGIEPNPPNSRKKPSTAAQARSTQTFGDATGKCSICSSFFSNAQDFYEHLEDCVLNVVQRIDPSEAINEQLLTSVADDANVKESLERASLPTSLDNTAATYGEGDEEEEEDESGEDNEGKGQRRTGQVGASHVNESGAIAKPGSSSRGRAGGRGPGITYSKYGFPLARSGRKRRKNYPNSWGCNAEKMKVKKRVLTVFDGPRRLAKDDMMLNNEYEVRIPLPDASNGAYITDLDVQTLQRADGFFTATEEEKGPWEQFVTNAPDGNMGGLVP